MKKLLLIMGDLACGKSTFADILSKRYKTSLFFKDSIKEVLGDTIGFSDRAENLELSRSAAGLMNLIFVEFAKLDKDLILESNFRSAELEKIHTLASKKNYEVLTLVLRADIGILYERFLNSMHNENRHPVHLCGEFNSFDGFADYVENQRTSAVPGPSLLINADDFSYQTDPDILAVIDSFMGSIQSPI